MFEVDPTSQADNVDKSPVPLPFLGRYSHEAVAVDPDTQQIYLTEDAVTPERSLLPLDAAGRLRRRHRGPARAGPDRRAPKRGGCRR